MKFLIKKKTYIESQIAELKITEFNLLGSNINIFHKLSLTMIDGKVCNAITQTLSCQKCNIYEASRKEMNAIDMVINKPTNQDALLYGLSV